MVAALIWLFLTNPEFGLLNNILRGVGAKPVTWLGASTALPTLAAVDVWRNAGYWAIFFVAALIGLLPHGASTRPRRLMGPGPSRGSGS